MSRRKSCSPSADWRLRALAVGSLGLACATLADGAPGLDNPPSARAGPFRTLVIGELGQGRVAPFAVSDQTLRLRDVSVLDVDGDPATFEVEGYFAASADDAGPESPSIKIVRLQAVDGRSFTREPETVLEPSQDWEGGRVGAPSVLFDGGGLRRIYYEAEGGIGVAIEESGSFSSMPAPLLSPADVPWASTSIRSPGVVRLSDGSYRLYFETDDEDGVPVIGLASSEDGLDFVDQGPILTVGEGDDLDAVFVGSPFPVLAESAEGRSILFLYFTMRSKEDKQAIGLAARFLDAVDEDLDKTGAAMYGPPGGVEPREPCVIRFEEFSFLFATQKPARNSTDILVIVSAAPGGIELPPPNPP